MCSDKQPDLLPHFVFRISGLNPALGDWSFMSFTGVFKLYLGELLGKSCSYVNMSYRAFC